MDPPIQTVVDEFIDWNRPEQTRTEFVVHLAFH